MTRSRPKRPDLTKLREILERIEERLEVVGLSANAASEMAGLSRDAIRNIQRAFDGTQYRRGVTTHTLEALAPVLGTTVEWLINGTRTITIEVQGGMITRISSPQSMRDVRMVVIDRDTDSMGEDEDALLSVIDGDPDDLALVTVYDDGPDELAPTPTWEVASE